MLLIMGEQLFVSEVIENLQGSKMWPVS